MDDVCNDGICLDSGGRGESCQFHHLQFPNNLSEGRSFGRVALPALLHQFGEALWTLGRNGGSEFPIQHFLGYLGAIDVAVGGFSGCDFPQYDGVAEDICLLGVGLAADDLGGHPLVGPYLVRHVFLQGLRPPEVSDLDPQTGIEEDVQALEVSMQDRGGALMQIKHSLCDLHC